MVCLSPVFYVVEKANNTRSISSLPVRDGEALNTTVGFSMASGDKPYFLLWFNQSYRGLSLDAIRKANGRIEGFVISDGKGAD